MSKKKVYLIQESSTQLFKIGITKKNAEQRKKELQTGNASSLSVIYEFETNHDFKLEKAVHAHFRIKKVNSEWFELTNEDVCSFIEVCKQYESIYDSLKDNPFVF